VLWEQAWRALSRRVDAWNAVVATYLQQVEHIPVDSMQEAANSALDYEAAEILAGIGALDLPPALRQAIGEVERRLGPLLNISQGKRVLAHRWVVLSALRAPLDVAVAVSEEPRRRLIERAFLHLNRTLAIDENARRIWLDAFSHETRCEQVGALHLLSHGVYAFKADATSGRTDLILGEPFMMTEDVRSADAIVLTEWKLVRPGENTSQKALEGKAQMDRYASNELAGFELRRHRYVVLVSRAPLLPMPTAEISGDVTYHYVNIAIEPPTPSQQSRQVSRI
jgi:hypothetical protein